MQKRLRENTKLLVVMVVCLAAGAVGPAVAGSASRVLFADNADKVDGKHAVGSGATVSNRAGKLVATSPTTGRLPNNIIAKAPDSSKLNGLGTEAFFEGSTLVLVRAEGSPAANGTALKAAMAAITDAAPDHAYAVRLSPGVYDVGAAGLQVKPFVELVGSGVDRTIVTAPGSPDTSPFDGGIYGTLHMAGQSSARHLTVQNTGGTSTIAVGVETGDGVSRLFDVGIEVSGSDEVGYGIAAQLDVSAPSVYLDHGVIEVAAGVGIGNLTSTDEFHVVEVHDSRITVTGGGAGVAADAQAQSGSYQRVVDTTIHVSGGGAGITGTADGQMTFEGVDVTVTGGTSSVGLSGSGSGLHPVVKNSTFTVSGGSSANKGVDGALFVFITLQNTRMTVTGTGATGIELGLGTTDSGTAIVDSSVITAQTIINSINADTQVSVGASKLAGNTITNGAGTFTCVASYKSNYTALSATCT